VTSLSRMLLLLALAGPVAAAPPTSEPAQPPANGETEDAPASPRGSVVGFLEAARARDFEAAARSLDLPPSRAAQGPELARQLKAVLDRYLWINPERISGAVEGDTADGLPPDQDRIGFIEIAGRPPEPLILVRRGTGENARWLVSRSTLAQVPGWYGSLGNRWALENLPPALLRTGPLQIFWWQWLALPLALLVAWAIGAVLARGSHAVGVRLARRTAAPWDDALMARARAPLSVVWTLLALRVSLALLGLTPPADAFLRQGIRLGLLFAIFWGLVRAVDVASGALSASPWGQARPAFRSILPIAGRMAKIAVVMLALVTGLSEMGFPVASLLAGLGIGGIAFALAAQKTVENLFGAVAIGLDQPIREGDFVKVEDFVGTVEAIGLRSTRIRTLDRTVVSLPNGRIADMRLESFTARDRMRLACEVGLEYRTTEAQMREVLAGLEGVLRGHPRIWPDAVVVRFKQFGASSLDIEIMAWFQTAEWSEFQLIRQEVLLQFMGVVERAGTGFAFPTRTVHLAPPAGG
jgi:MscS family membrane protein